jgi:hypothetical protein
VMRQLNLDLGRLCLENPIQGLAVIDILRGDPWLEPQLIAVGLLGQMPPDDLVTGRLEEWARPKLVKPVLDALLVEGTARLRREAPDDFLELVHKWLINPDPAVEAMGLRALYPLVEERSYENLPAVFNLLSNAIHSVSNLTQNPLQRLIEALASRSATETSFFIRQMASVTSDPSVKRFMRRCIPLLPARAQSGLRDLL